MKRRASKHGRLTLMALAVAVGIVGQSIAATLRIVSYNIDDDTGGMSGTDPKTNYTNLGTVLQAIGTHHLGDGNAQPIDVLALTELHYDNPTISSSLTNIVNKLNSIYGAGTYAYDPYVGDTSGNLTGNGPSGLIYNTNTVRDLGAFGLTVQADGTTPLVSGSAAGRQPIRYELRPKGYASDSVFYLYADHYKASGGSANVARRNVEAQAVRYDSDALGSSAHVIYAGDFNLTGGSTEPAYVSLRAAGNGQANDPLNATTPWGIQTASESSDDLTIRFDFQLVTSATLNQPGTDINPASYEVFGNNGSTPSHGSIGDPTNTALSDLANRTTVLGYLSDQSVTDHLPVVADYFTTGINPAIVWNGGTGNWSTAGKWNGGVVPNSSAAQVLSDDGNPTNSVVSLDQNATVEDLSTDASDTFNINATRTLTLAGPVSSLFLGTVNNSGTMVVSAGTASLLGGGTHSGSFAISSGATLEFGGGTHALTSSSSITGAGNVLVSAGLLQLSGSNSYGGATTITGGVVQAEAASLMSANSAVTVAVGGTLDLNNFNQTVGSIAGAGSITLGSGALTAGGNNTSTTMSGVISGSGSLIKTGSGTLQLPGNTTYGGTTTVNGGTLALGTLGDNSFAYSGGDITLANGATLRVLSGKHQFSNQNFIFNSTGGSTIDYAGDGSEGGFTLVGSKTFTTNGGATNIISASGTSGKINLNNAASTTFNIARGSDPTSDLTVSAQLSNTAGTISKTGNGILTLNGANSFTGPVQVSSGTLRVGSNTAMGTGAATVAGASLLASNGVTVSNNITVGAATTLTPFTVGYSFATASPSSTTGSGFTAGSVAQGNNNGTTTLITAVSPSSGYTGASGGNNAGAADRTGALNTGASGSAYFEFTLSPLAGSIALNAISFGSRSTSTGPQAYTLRSSLDNFTADLATGSMGSNSSWVLFSPALTSTSSTSPITYRLFGYNGTGSPGAGAANWRIDDLALGGNSGVASGTTTILGSDNSGAATFAGNVTLNGDVSLTAASGGNVLFSGALTGGSQVNKIGAGTVTLGGANTYTGATNISAGNLTLASNLTTSSAVNVTGGKVELSAGGSRIVKTPAVSVTGTGQIDLKDNKLITQSAIGVWNGSNYDGVTGMIKAGRNGGMWNGVGIVTSMTAASGSGLTTLAVATAAQAGKASFGGQSVAPTDVLVMYTYAGDANLDGKVNADDYFQIDSNYNKTSNASKSYFDGDFNYDGQINADDYFLIDNAFAAQGVPFTSALFPGGVSAVPEPAEGFIFAAFMLASCRRRRRPSH